MEENQNIENNAVVENKDEEISLIDLFAVLLKYKKLIIVTVLAAMIFAVVFSVISLKLPPEKSYLPAPPTLVQRAKTPHHERR